MNNKTEEDFDAIKKICSPKFNRELWDEYIEDGEVPLDLSPCIKCKDEHPIMVVTSHYRVICPYCGHGTEKCWRTNATKAVMAWEHDTDDVFNKSAYKR